ncbi:MAG TPA: hypothetical protein VK850_10790 [Candidatus Binatia bacterium]|nr:hypothetical protein [Candidatus Binatia bacterium]
MTNSDFCRGLACVVLGAILLGCSNTTKPPVAATAPAPITIDKLNLLAAPIAFNLDGVPGPDAVMVKIYAGNVRNPKPVAITSGTVDLLAFEGLLGTSTNVPQPFKTWTFTASELRRMQFKASIGIGYEITASFVGLKPRADKLTILARYRSDPSHAVYSSPSTISLTAN